MWARWLHGTHAARALLEGTNGERIPRDYHALTVLPDGRYERSSETLGPVAKWLPNVTVWVCSDCNSGWMSRLEDNVKRLLGPFVESDLPVRLTVEDLTTLATWATKCWMAYALTRPRINNPFRDEEYRTMASAPAPLARSRIWLMRSHSPSAQVSLGLQSTLVHKGVPDLTTAPDNTAYGFLAAAEVVIFMTLVPAELPGEALDVMSPDFLCPMPGVRECWPLARAQYFPLESVDHAVIHSLIEHPRHLFEAMGLPTGESTRETEHVYNAFLKGADAAELRASWTSPLRGGE